MSSEHIHVEPPSDNHNPPQPRGEKNAAMSLAPAFVPGDGKSPTAPVRILRLPEVMNRVGLKRASIYAAITRGAFPKQIALSDRTVGWIEQEIEDWLEARIKASRSRGGISSTTI